MSSLHNDDTIQNIMECWISLEMHAHLDLDFAFNTWKLISLVMQELTNYINR
ncbi:hypothetical protein HanIR_Chr03g0113671 [Helianthus annuus]|nr:hypothetical protein HanIR_Chr03g0113671 [Helianthus annuus]